MADKQDKIVIVGASSLLGKELAEELTESPFAAAHVTLVDEEESDGKLEAIGDEVTVIQKMDADSFAGADFVFFASDAATTEKHWQEAMHAGASVVDLSYALEKKPGAMLRVPRLGEGTRPDLKTPAVVSAHPAAIMLATVLGRLGKAMQVRSIAATALLPASESGTDAMDELHQQTVSLLSLQELPKEHFDAQAAFNLLPAFGSESRVSMTQTANRIRNHWALLTGNKQHLALLTLQAPVFHAIAIAAMVELDETVSLGAIESALSSEQIDLMLDDTDPPTNLSAAGQSDVLVRVRPEPPESTEGTRFWVWMTADNLKLTAANAVACALELKAVRPSGSVQ